jgi:cysteine desulfurase/selenocysteine lyase
LTSRLNILISDCRSNIANFFGVDASTIIFTSGATESINLIASNFYQLIDKNQEILASTIEHSSLLLPFIVLEKQKKIRIKYVNNDSIPTINDYINNITKKTRIVLITLVSNFFGNEIDVITLIKKARTINKNLIFIVDGTQFSSSNQIDLKKADIDFYVCSAHKIMGPTGIGILYGKKQYLETFLPLKYGGGMNTIIKHHDYKLSPLPSRLEAGTINSAGIIGMSAGIEYLRKLNFNRIKNHKISLKKYFDQKIKKIPNIEYYNYQRLNPVFIFNIKGINPQDLANYLGRNQIITRAGQSCVKLQHLITNNLAGAVRASFYVYNDKSDIDKLIAVLKKFRKSDIAFV